MHELSITRNVVAIACEHAGTRRVHSVHLRVGALSGIDPEAVRFCYDLCTEGTVAAGSRLEIEQVPGRARCDECQKELPLEAPIALCPCERRATLTRLGGDELLVTAMEVEDV